MPGPRSVGERSLHTREVAGSKPAASIFGEGRCQLEVGPTAVNHRVRRSEVRPRERGMRAHQARRSAVDRLILRRDPNIWKMLGRPCGSLTVQHVRHRGYLLGHRSKGYASGL